MTCNGKCTPTRMERLKAFVHHANMANDPRHFLRKWRKHRDLTLEDVAARIEMLSAERAFNDPEARAMTMTHATLSRIERGKLPYNQHLLELLAEIYRTDIATLLMRDPEKAEAIWDIWEQLAPVQREQVVEIAKTIKRTGTGG